MTLRFLTALLVNLSLMGEAYAAAPHGMVAGTGILITGPVISLDGDVITDGDKGDITVSASGATWTIDDGTVTSAKLASLTSAQLAGKLSDETGSGAAVFAASPTLVTPILGTPTSGILTNATGLPVGSGISGLGTGVATALAAPSSANVATAVTDETGSGALCFATSPALVTPLLGTPTSGTLTNCTGLPIGSGVSGLGSGVATFLATPSSANLATAVTNETGSGALVFGTAPSITGGSHTAATALAVAAGVNGPITMPAYVSGRFYLPSPLSAGITAANTTPLVDGTEYAVLGVAWAPVSVHSISLRTSTTSAQIGASIKVCVYAADGANGAPGTLLGSTAAGTSFADATASLDKTINLDANTTVGPGPFWVALLQTSTTGLRFVENSGVVAFTQTTGNASAANLFSGTSPIYGYTVAQAYASGCASPFGTPVVNNTVGLNPAFSIEVQ